MHRSKTMTLMCRSLYLFLLLMSWSLIAGAAETPCEDVVFSHLAPSEAPAGLDLTISGLISGLNDGDAIRILYRRLDAGEFITLETWLTGGLFDAAIPAAVIAPPGLEYYIEVGDETGDICAYPEGAPIDRVFEVQVDSAEGEQAGSGGSPPAITQIAPDVGLPLAAADLVVVIGFSDPDGDLAPEGIILKAGGRDVTHEATIRADVLTWIPDAAPTDGLLDLTCEARDDAGNATRLRTTIHLNRNAAAVITPQPEADRSRGPKGRISLNSLFTELEGDGAVNRQEPVRVIDGRLDARGQLGFVKYRAKAFMTSDDRSEVQPRNRFQLKLTAGPLSANLGDVNPRFNPLLIWGQRVRGGELALNLQRFQTQLVYGAMTRAVEGAGHDSLDISAPDGIRTIIDQAGTYRRDLMGLRLGFGSGRVMGFGLELLKIKDKIESIEYGLLPKDNVVLGTDLKLRLFSRRLQINTAAALSILTNDITGGALTKAEADSTFGIDLPFDPENFENLLVINSSTAPIEMSGLPNLAVQSTIKAFLSVNRLELRFRRIGASYYCLATNTLPRDQLGIRFRDDISLPGKGIRLSAEFETYHDNLEGDQDHTLTTRIYAGDIAYRPRGTGALSFLHTRLRLHEQSNGERDEDEGVRNRTLQLSLNGSLRLALGPHSQHLNASTHLSRRLDDISDTGESSGLNMFLQSRTGISGMPLTIGLMAGRTANSYPGLIGPDGEEGLDANFMTLQASANYLSSKHPIRFIWRQVNGEGTLSGAGSSRSTFRLEGEYHLEGGVALTGRLGMAQFDDESDADLDYDEAFLSLGLEQRF
ncbi:MAG: hypothetical protein GY835_02075 [bacterium]|nr:hypothetical protein [bacterium]